MRHAIAFAIVFVALTATGTRAQAQKVYKCGNTYSQTPCGEGKTLDTTASEPSTDIARKQIADKENKRQLAAAKALEKERLATDAEVRRRHALEAKALEQEKARTTKGAGKDSAKKKEGPQFFTAKQVPPTKP